MKTRRATRRATRTGVGALVAAAVLFVLSGCMKMNVDFKIDGDSVNGTIIMAVDKKLAAISGKSEQALVDEITKSAPDEPGVTEEKYDDGTFVGQKYTLDNVPLEKLAEDQDEDELKIVHDKAAKRYTVTGTMDLASIKTDDPTTSAFMGSLDIRISITFPGKVLEHNGELDGTTVTWKPKAGEKTDLKAVSEEASPLAALTGGSGSGSNTVLVAAVIGGGVLLLLIIVLIVVLMSRRKKAPAYPTDPYAAQPGYPGYPASGPPAGYPASGPPAGYPAGGYPAPAGSPAGYPTPPGSPAGYPSSGGGYPGSPPAHPGGGVYGSPQPDTGYPQPQQPQYPQAPQQQPYQQQPYPPNTWPPNQPGA